MSIEGGVGDSNLGCRSRASEFPLRISSVRSLGGVENNDRHMNVTKTHLVLSLQTSSLPLSLCLSLSSSRKKRIIMATEAARV